MEDLIQTIVVRERPIFAQSCAPRRYPVKNNRRSIILDVEALELVIMRVPKAYNRLREEKQKTLVRDGEVKRLPCDQGEIIIARNSRWISFDRRKPPPRARLEYFCGSL